MVLANRFGYNIFERVNKNVLLEQHINKGKNMKCENCGEEHDGSYGSGRFCSLHCRKSYIAKKVKNRKSGFAIYSVKRKASYGTWKC